MFEPDVPRLHPDVPQLRRFRRARDTPPGSSLPLCNDTLSRHARYITVPRYSRSALRAGVVHLGVGSFHRSHQAVYLDDLAARGHREWGIVGVGFRDSQMLDALVPQDLLYTVVSRGADRDEARAVGVLTRYLMADTQREAVLSALCEREVAIVTLTVTAGAYREHQAAAKPGFPGRVFPTTAVEFLVEALDRRRRNGGRPFTVMSCDNMPANGAVARQAVVDVARTRDARLAAWIEEHVAFPSSMVDRITPQTVDLDIDFVERRFGVRDRWPVITEPFSQWVVENSFSDARPPLDEVGVQFVPDVAPYALMKTQLLNATHSAIGYLGSLAGLRRADELMADPVFQGYVAALMDREVAPLLDPVPGVDLGAYKRSLLGRLANPKLADDLARLCRGGSAKVPAHLLPSIAEARRRGRPHRMLTLAVAGWLRYLTGTDMRGRPFPLDDPRGEHLRSLARAGGDDPRVLLDEYSVFGSLGRDQDFASSVREALDELDAAGPRGAIRTCLAEYDAVPA